MLQRVEEALEAVVEVVRAVVRWVDVDLDRQVAGQRANPEPGEDHADRFAVGAPLAADQYPVADVPVEPVGRNRVGEAKLHFAQRFGRPIRGYRSTGLGGGEKRRSAFPGCRGTGTDRLPHRRTGGGRRQ